MLRRCGAIFTAGVAAVVLAGCGGSAGSTGAAPPPTTAPTVTVPACPTIATKAPVWPAKVPKDLPKPPQAHILSQQTASDGVYVLKFRTDTSLRSSVLFVVEHLPKAGYVLGRGDAEATEADAPFLHGNTRGLIRMLETGACTTDWLLATVDTQAPVGNSPLLTPHTPTGSPSPLPFG
ncbi:MAG: hypothetical protein QOF18_1415 [Frankiaceae bacterium]|jgi:hypothetical protein|nr:hypothetical protein [Frankiaceae bacterium]